MDTRYFRNSLSHASLLLGLVFLLMFSGCISQTQSENVTPVTVINTTVIPAESPAMTTAATSGIASDPTTEQEVRSRPTLTIVRGEPFSISGVVKDHSITAVQVWLINRSFFVYRVPVREDGTYQALLSPGDTAALPRDYTAALVIQYPRPPENFTVTLDKSTGKVVAPGSVPQEILSEINNHRNYPTTIVDYLDQAITDYASGNSCDIYFPDGVDAALALNPIPPGPPGSMIVSGNTTLPAGTPISITVITANMHPTPKNYDFSHEIAEGTAIVRSTEGENHLFEGTVDTSRLYTGKYMVLAETRDSSLQAHSQILADIIAPVTKQPGNYINWSALSLPPLTRNQSMIPVMLGAGWKLVVPGTQRTANEVPFGSIIYCTVDGICRVFDESGMQYLAAYNSNEAHMLEVPNGAMIDTEGSGNVSRISLDGKTILTKIDEVTREG